MSALQPVSPATLQHLREELNRYVRTTNIPGINMLVYQNEEVIFQECAGLADLETRQPMQPDTLFRIASMTKPIASTAALMLVDAGKLNLHDPVERYIPEFGPTKVVAGVKDGKLQLEDQQRPMTLFDVLTHTAGIPYEPREPLLAKLHTEIDLWNRDRTLEEMMRALASVPLAFQSGDDWEYGLSHDIVSRIVEVAGEMPFDAFLEEKIFAPLGMKDTAFQIPEEKTGRIASLYDISEEEPKRLNVPFTKPSRGGAGLFSTLGDYLRFSRMLLNNGELEGVRLLKPQTVAEMARNQLTGKVYPIRFAGHLSHGEGYGLGVGVMVEPVVAAIAGSQGTYGWSGSESTHFWIDPARQLIGIILAQFNPYFHVRIDHALREIVYQGDSKN